jgi:hypothetical protein
MIPRAQRFNAAMRLLWRPQGGVEWYDAEIVNSSRSGVLFRPNRPIEIDKPIELLLPMGHEQVGAVHVADVLCAGRVVRAAQSADRMAFAATIDSYLFLREP